MNEVEFSKSRYTHRDYETIKADLLEAVPSLTKKWTDFNEASPGVVYIKLLSMMSDNLSYNFDKQALEVYKSTVTQRKNCAKILRLLGYKMKWYQSARVNVTVQYITDSYLGNSEGETAQELPIITYKTTLRAGDKSYVVIRDASSVGEDTEYSVGFQKTYTLNDSFQSITFECIEGYIGNTSVSKSSVTNNKVTLTESKIDSSIIWLEDNNGNILGELVDDIKTETDPYKLCYSLEIDDYDNPYLIFCDTWKELMGSQIDTFNIKYILSSGENGSVTDNAFTDIDGRSTTDEDIVLYNKANYKDTLDGRPGHNPETVEEAVNESAKYVFTHDTLVTEKDFERACLRISGMVGSKLLDNFLIEDGNLDINKIATLDNIPLDDAQARLKVGSIILYLLYRDFDKNHYCGNNVWRKHAGTEKLFSLRSYNWNKSMTEYKPAAVYGTAFYPYKLNQETQNTVKKYIDSKKNMTVTEYFGTSRMYPYLIGGSIFVYNPLSPKELIEVATRVDKALSELLATENLGYATIPDMMSIVECIQNADNRIRYFASGRIDPIQYIIDKTVTDNELTYPTSVSVYEGLAWQSKMYDNYTSYTNVPTFNPIVFNKETMTFKVSYTQPAVGSEESTTPQITSISELNVPPDLTDEESVKYEKITLTTPIPTGTKAYITCTSLAQVNTLSYNDANSSVTGIRVIND